MPKKSKKHNFLKAQNFDMVKHDNLLKTNILALRLAVFETDSGDYILVRSY